MTLDDRDATMRALRLDNRNKRTGPRVGDFVIMTNGELRRFSHHWGDALQTTWKGTGGSFYLDRDGGVSYSGALDPSIPIAALIDTGVTRDGEFWFFHHDHQRAHNGVYFAGPCRVYRHEPNRKET